MTTKTGKALLSVLAVLVAIGLLASVGVIIKNKFSEKELPVYVIDTPEMKNETGSQANASKFTFKLEPIVSQGKNETLKIKNLEVKDSGTTWIYWTWENPENENFGKCMIYINDRNVKNTTREYYNATNLNPGTNNTIKICVVDKYGVKQSECVSSSAMTLEGRDTAPPSPIDNLAVESKTTTSIKWTWTNPSESDFDKAIVYINGINVKNTTENYYEAKGLAQNTIYTITVHTMDTEGNINTQNVTNSTRTCLDVCSFGKCRTYCV